MNLQFKLYSNYVWFCKIEFVCFSSFSYEFICQIMYSTKVFFIYILLFLNSDRGRYVQEA